MTEPAFNRPAGGQPGHGPQASGRVRERPWPQAGLRARPAASQGEGCSAARHVRGGRPDGHAGAVKRPDRRTLSLSRAHVRVHDLACGHGHGHEQGHGHAHEHGHEHGHGHGHGHGHDGGGLKPGSGSALPPRLPARRYSHGPEKALVLRPNSGVSGDILAAGLCRMAGFGQKELEEAVGALGIPELRGRVRLIGRSCGAVSGWGLEISLPRESRHRNLEDIREIFGKSSLTPGARALALESFRLLAEAEAGVHGVAPSEVTFHEVGALDSILDAGLSSLLFDLIGPDLFVSGPLPLCDGTIKCAHGLLPSPAPAVLRLLKGVPVRGIESEGETVTPTGLSLLLAFGAVFGPWPEMTVDAQALCYGSRTLPGVPNGALFALGRLRAASKRPSADGGEHVEHA